MEVGGSVQALKPPPLKDLHFVNVAVAHANVVHVPLHQKCSAKINFLKSTFGCLSDSVLNQDDDNKVVNHLLDINDNANSFLTQSLDDDDNIVSIAEEDEVYDQYGFWMERPRDP